jgi:DNA polymerase (family 10)
MNAASDARLPSNSALAEQFELLADLMEIDGGDPFRVGAYRRAATRIRETSTSVALLALDLRAKELQGIGKTIEQKILEVVHDGEIHALTKRKSEVPVELAAFLRLPGLGPKTARRLWKELGISSIDALRVAAEAGSLRDLEGLGPKSEQNIIAALARPQAATAPGRVLLGVALGRLEEIAAALQAHPAAVQVSIAGSARRARETVRDLDLIATATEPAALIDAFCAQPQVVEVLARGETKATIVGPDGLSIDLRVVPPASYGNLLQHFTGSKDHNVALREAAVRRGLSVSEYAVSEIETGVAHSFASEEEVYAFLGYPWIAPELRENRGELEAALRGELPVLIDPAALRGDLHTHTTWSDGRDSLEAMVAAASERGYAYYAICDHSQRLREGGFERQAEAIARINEHAPLRVLRGVEANIRTDGTIDVADDELAQLDWVVASLHQSFERDGTKRVLAAMENPYVDCIGHPTARLIGARAGAALEIDRVIEKALETGTFLEINSQPDRLDLSDVHARAAAEAGVRLVINSDGHSTAALGNVLLGVSQARRAWLRAEDVVNTRSWAEIEQIRKPRPGSVAR